jgi:hypothetical protein
VNVRERIAKLEAILARIGQRASAPRETNGGGAAAHAPVEAQADDPVVSSEPITPLDVEVTERTEEVPAVAEAVLAVEVESRERIIAATEQPTEEREPEPSPSPISVETGERPAASLAPETDVSDAPELTVSTVSDAPEVLEVEEVEAAEEPPASSRRPIAIEPKLEELAFGEAAPVEEVPHSAPPESGRQVAVAPVDLDFEGEFTGVRPRDPEGVPVTVLGDVAKGKAEAVPLVAEATAAKLSGSAAVIFEGAAPVFKPATFGELLDATLLL